MVKPIVELDMSGNHFADPSMEVAVKNIIKDLRNIKRTAPAY
jgi:Ran GTPase-activating protein (RanGAP) involved in mRNA processing and transport